MKAAILFLACVTLVSAFKLENVKRATHAGQCPLVDTNVLGFCMYDPTKNCLSDDQCRPIDGLYISIGIFIFFFIIFTILTCWLTYRQRTQKRAVLYSYGVDQQTRLTTANTTPGLHHTHPYSSAEQYNMVEHYGYPGHQFGAPGQQFIYPTTNVHLTDQVL